MPVSPTELAIALVVTIVGAIVQGTIGIGFAVLSVPILSLINPILAPVPQLLLAVPLAMSMTWRERHHIEFSRVSWMLAGRIPGAVLGLALLGVATQRTLDIGIASSVLVAVAILGAGLSLPRRPLTDLLTGIVAGMMGMVASMGGPPSALLFKDAKGPTVRSSLALFFSIGLSVTVALRLAAGRITGDDVLIALMLLPGLLIGYITSSRLRHRLDGDSLRPAILVVSTIAAAGLLIRAFS